MPVSAAAEVVALAALMVPSRARAQLRARVTAPGFGNASTNRKPARGDTASLIVTVTGTALATASAGSYSGVLSVTIAPN